MTHASQLIYLAFGEATYQREAVFSISSGLAHLGRDARNSAFGIRVFTDSPGYYEKLPAEINAIDPKWAGPHRYHFRIKHAALLETLKNCEKAILIDTDTFFRQSPETLFSRVTPGSLLCNAIGRPLGAAPALPKEMLVRLARDNLLCTDLHQTNSGVIGLAHDDQKLLEHSIAWMDELRPMAPELYTLEELSLALAAHGTLELRSCTDVVHHYWSRKTHFRAKVEAWFNKHHHAPLSEEAMHDALLLNDRLPRPPHPNRGWQKLLTSLTPPTQKQFYRELLYGCHTYANEFDRACASSWWDKAIINAQKRHGLCLAPEEVEHYLNNPILKMLAGDHYKEMRSHIMASFRARRVPD